MSYILDALNKSEQERRGQKTPDLQTVHRAPPAKERSPFPTMLVIGIFAFINVIGIGYWLYNSQPTEVVATSEAPVVANSEPVTVANPEPKVATTIQENSSTNINTNTQNPPAAATINTNIDETEGLLITPDSAFQKPSNDPVRITELPINIQRQIPDLVFSSHLYSDEPDFRMVNINGRMIREGDMVAGELKLREISEEGVILGFRHYVFEVSVLRDWSFN